jgi:hypothetical protein
MGQPAPTSKTHIDEEAMEKHRKEVGIPMDMLLDEDGMCPTSPEPSLGGFSHDSDSSENSWSTPRKQSARNHIAEEVDGNADSRTWPDGGADEWSERGDETAGVRRTRSPKNLDDLCLGLFGRTNLVSPGSFPPQN